MLVTPLIMVKSSLFMILIVSLSLNIPSQSYHKLIEPNKSWDVSNTTCGFAYCTWYTTTTIIGSDTLISGRKYFKLHHSIYGVPHLGRSDVAIREDTSKQQVYIYTYNEEKESILYDFSLKEKDTILINKWGHSSKLIVDSVTTKNINGQSRKMIVFIPDLFYYGIWIEGIGSNHGLLFSDFNQGLMDASNELNCVHIDDSLIYMDPRIWTCNQTNVFADQQVSSQCMIRVLTDPIRFIFIGLDTEESTILIYNINGQMLADYKLNGEKEFEPSLGNLEGGIYLYKFVSQKLNQDGKFLIIK